MTNHRAEKATIREYAEKHGVNYTNAKRRLDEEKSSLAGFYASMRLSGEACGAGDIGGFLYVLPTGGSQKFIHVTDAVAYMHAYFDLAAFLSKTSVDEYQAVLTESATVLCTIHWLLGLEDQAMLSTRNGLYRPGDREIGFRQKDGARSLRIVNSVILPVTAGGHMVVKLETNALPDGVSTVITAERSWFSGDADGMAANAAEHDEANVASAEALEKAVAEMHSSHSPAAIREASRMLDTEAKYGSAGS